MLQETVGVSFENGVAVEALILYWKCIKLLCLLLCLWKPTNIDDPSPSCINVKELNLAINEECHVSAFAIMKVPSSSVN